jgi:DNA-directed RNA polymerase subunit RPC12/RpoP
MNANLIKCKCNNCSSHIEFDAETAGETVQCPNCSLETVLFVPSARTKEPPIQRPPNLRACPDCGRDVSKNAPTCPNCGARISSKRSDLKKSTIVCSYIVAVLMPFAGFFVGIYLLLKKEFGHGVSVMALSLLFGSILWTAIALLSQS